MAQIVNTIRWATNVEELKRNLQDGLNQIEVTRAGADRMVQSLSGDKLIQAAHKYAAAVQEMGGANRLTATEQDRVNAVLDRAIEKYGALGKSIPTAIQNLSSLLTANQNYRKEAEANAAANDKAADSHSKLGEVLRLNIPLFAGMSSRITENVAALGMIGAAVAGVAIAIEIGKKAIEFGVQVSEDAKQLRNLSTETGVGVEQLQAIGAATRDFGVNADELGRGIFQLSRRIAGDDTSAAAALRVMGLSIEELKGKSPDQMFLEVVRALNQIPDAGLRATIGAQLFGARFAQAILAIGPDLDALIQKARDLGEVQSKDGVEGSAKFADSLDHLENRMKVLADQTLAPLLVGLANYIELAQRAMHLAPPAPPAPATGPTFGPSWMPTPAPNALSTGLNIQLGTSAADLARIAAMANALDGLRKSIVPLTAEQTRYLQSLAALGPAFLTTENLLGTGISPQQLNLFREMVNLQQQRIKATADAARLNAQAEASETDGLQNAVSTRIAALDAEHQAFIAETNASLESDQSKSTKLIDAEKTYQAQRRVLEAEGAAAVQEIQDKASADILKAQGTTHAATLAEQLAAIDAETALAQRAALQKIGYTENEWQAEYAIFLAGEAKKQALKDNAGKAEVDAERKLRAEIAGLDEQDDTTGLARTMANIAAKQNAEVAALNAEVLTDEDYEKRFALIDEKYSKERRNARLANDRETGKEEIQIRQQIDDATIELLLTGEQAELALNDAKRKRVIDQLHQQGKDQTEAERQNINDINALFDLQAQKIIQKYDPIAQAWRGLNTDIRQQWADTWAQALAGTGSFVDALISPFHQIEQEWLKLIGAMVADWEGQLLSHLGLPLPGVNTSSGGGLASLIGGIFGGGGAGAATAMGPVAAEDIGGIAVTAGLPSGLGVGATAAGGAALGMGASVATSIALGAVTMGIGIAVPFIIMGLKKLFGGRSITDQIAQDEGHAFGMTFSDSLVKTIADRSQQMQAEADKQAKLTGGPFAHAPNENAAATLMSLGDIIKEHPIDSSNLDTYLQKEHDIFSAIQQGTLTVQQASEALDNSFPQIAAAATDSFGLVRKEIVDIINLDRQMGTESKAVADFIQNQISTNVVPGLTAFLSSTKVSSQATATAVGEAIGATVLQLRLNGASYAQIFKDLGPLIAQFQRQLSQTGFSGGEAFDHIAKLAKLAGDAIAGPVLSSIDGITTALVGLANSDLLTPDMFAGLANQVGKMTADLVAKGFSQDDIIQSEQPSLQRLWELEDRFGFKVDDVTQKLIDQAAANGQVGAQFESQSDRAASSLDNMTLILAALAHMWGVVLPDNVQKYIDSLNRAAAATPGAPPAGGTSSPGPVETQPGPGDGGGYGYGYSKGGVVHMAIGGVVPRGLQAMPAMRYLDTGGSAGSPYWPFIPRGSDTVPAMLTPDEWVFNDPQQQRLLGQLQASASMASAIERIFDASSAPAGGRSGAPSKQPLIVHVMLPDAGRIATAVIEDIGKGGSTGTKFGTLVKQTRS